MKIFKTKRRNSSRNKLIETTITLRTKYLERELKSFFNINVILSLLALSSAVLTAISSFSSLSLDASFSDIQPKEWFSYFLAFVTIILSALALFSIIKTASPKKFINKMIQDQYDVEEFTAIFIIKMVFDNVPKILVFRSETWNSYFLPYCHYDDNTTQNKDFMQKLKTPLAEILEINENDIEIFNDFEQSDYTAIKKNPSHERKSKINYKFFYVRFNNQYVSHRFTSTQNAYFSWKSKYELSQDIDTQLNNGDVISIIDELSLLNQSKLAFKEKPHGLFDVPSRYRIIWNITTECFFDCPICATNSGCSDMYKCKTTEKEKMQILINMSSINGYIDHLDISGGDPLKNIEDRNIIKMANQLFPYTQISVTTTGEALEKLSVDELVQTVKTCDITYDIPYNICREDLQEYRQYSYNYSNFKQLERFSNSGIKIALNIHIPILPVSINKDMIATILDDLNRISPVKVKFIRLMPVGRMNAIPTDYNPEQFLTYVREIMDEKQYKFKIEYNCSLGVRINNEKRSKKMCRNCEMLTNKLGIDANGYVYSCIWGAYIPEFAKEPKSNPFYLGDLKTETLYDILTNSQTIKLNQILKEKTDGCRVCGYIASSDGTIMERMLNGKDDLSEFYSPLNIDI